MANIYLDIETTGLDPYTCDIVTIQIMTESGKIMLLKDPETLVSESQMTMRTLKDSIARYRKNVWTNFQNRFGKTCRVSC